MSEKYNDEFSRRYLAKQLTPDEEIAFEVAMLDSNELTEQVILSQSLSQAVPDVAVLPQKVRKTASLPAWGAFALAAGISAWIWLPAALVTSGPEVSPAIVYLEDFRSHVTQPVTLHFNDGEQFKVIVSDAPPDFSGSVYALLTNAKGEEIESRLLKPNDNNEITLVIRAGDIDNGNYQLILSRHGGNNDNTEINRFSLEVKKD